MIAILALSFYCLPSYFPIEWKWAKAYFAYFVFMSLFGLYIFRATTDLDSYLLNLFLQNVIQKLNVVI